MTCFFGHAAAAEQNPTDNPIEIGLVDWGRDFEAASRDSEASGKPLLVLFQEVPGCAGCQKFGREVLSHPLIVEAIEDEFEPVVVFNNRSSGDDAALLKRFDEPAWNYQVLRFLDSEGRDVVPRKDHLWSVPTVASRMVEALSEADRPVPKYLRSIADGGDLASHERAAFAMHCYWTGEYRLGKIDGVLATEAGWLDGREVTLVTYDKDRIGLSALAQQAARVRCAEKVYTPEGESLAGLTGGRLDDRYRKASASDQKKQISRWKRAMESVPGINETQLTKINSLAPDDMRRALTWLSPRQRMHLNGALKSGG